VVGSVKGTKRILSKKGGPFKEGDRASVEETRRFTILDMPYESEGPFSWVWHFSAQ
jgi:hypothetical protein